MTGEAQAAGVPIDLSGVKENYGWNPNPDGKIHKEPSGPTSWFLDRVRVVLPPQSDYNYGDF
jgi:hypothetical protein